MTAPSIDALTVPGSEGSLMEIEPAVDDQPPFEEQVSETRVLLKTTGATREGSRRVRGKDLPKPFPPTVRPSIGYDDEGEEVAVSRSAEDDFFEDGVAETESPLPTEFEIWEALAPQLSPKQRFVLSRLDGWHDGYRYSQEEVAAAMGISQQAVSKLYRNATDKLRELARPLLTARGL